MTENYTAKFISDEASFDTTLIDFNIKDGTYTNLSEKNIEKASTHKPPFWVTFEFEKPDDPLIEYLVKSSKNPDTFRPQRVEIPVMIKEKEGTIMLYDGIIPVPVKQPSAMIELRFDEIEFRSA
ncbi:MAG: hypothetical protein HGA95_04650 [Caldiserica bacterium]|nr:hypothetical protein [Caldisericota bacterium]